MSTVSSSSESEASSAPLKPVLDERFALHWRHVLVCGWFALFFMYLNYMPLFYSDIWGHVHYGKWMLTHHELVDQDPFMPLAEGMHSVNNAWLSQVIMAKLASWGGAHYLSHLFAIIVWSAFVIHCRVYYLLTRRLSLMVVGMFLALGVGWTRHAVIRPEMFGYLCFAILIWMSLAWEPWASRVANSLKNRSKSSDGELEQAPRWLWLAVPLLFLFWANAHGSFAVGLVWLGCHALGRLMEVAWKTRNVLSVLQDNWLQRWGLLTCVALLTTLANPYGVDLLIETATFGKNPNLRDILEWYPLKLMDLEGVCFGASVVVMLALLRHSRARVSVADVLLWLFLVVSMAPTIRMIGWYAPVFAATMMPHLHSVVTRWLRRRGANQPEPMVAEKRELTAADFVPTVIAVFVAWMAFAFSPVSQVVLGGKERTPLQLYNQSTPLRISQYLREHPTDELVFSPQWWGDWLAWDGPPGLRVFMTTHIHLAPNRVWKDYLRVARGQTGWERVLDRYNVGMLVADNTMQSDLVRNLRGNEEWQIVYEDAKGLVATRNRTKPKAGNERRDESAEETDGSAPQPPMPAEPSTDAAANSAATSTVNPASGG